MKLGVRIFVVGCLAAAAFSVMVFGSTTAYSAEETKFTPHMKPVGKAMKAIKASVQKGEMTGIKENATTIATEIPKTREFEPLIHKDRKAEMPPLNDKAVEAAKALVSATAIDDAKVKFDALSKSCKACHEIFQPEE